MYCRKPQNRTESLSGSPCVPSVQQKVYCGCQAESPIKKESDSAMDAYQIELMLWLDGSRTP